MEQKIKVIHFIDRIGRGGTQAVLYDWLNNVDHSRFQFDFLVFMDGQEEYIDKFKKAGANIYQLPELSISNIPKFIKAIEKFFNENHYDIAHGHSKSKNILFLYAAKKCGIKVRIAHSHNTQFQRMALLGNVTKPLLRYVSTDYFACSDIAGKWLFGDKAFNDGKVTIVKNGVDTEKFVYDPQIRNEYRDKFSLGDLLVVGHVGKYTEQKNHTFLLDVFYEIQKRVPNSVLLLIGDGNDTVKQKVDEKISRLGVEGKVIKLGLRQDVPQLMQAMDVFLLPSLYEGLPVVGVEAQAAGLPVILSDTITQEVGLLPSTKYLSLHDSSERWAEEAIDAVVETNRTMASKCVYNQGYDSKLVASHLMDLYKEKAKHDRG